MQWYRITIPCARIVLDLYQMSSSSWVPVGAGVDFTTNPVPPKATPVDAGAE
jgi:hypothetical protein